MEPYFYETNQPGQPDRIELLRQRAEDYLRMEKQYQTLAAEYRATPASQRSDLAASIQALNLQLQTLRNNSGLIIGGLHGQEVADQIVPYDPAIHQFSIVHGDVRPGDAIRFMNTALCASNGTLLIEAQAIRVY
ncbi:hypothetical protein IPM65_04295 [Candidatus Roizmanbacteria bacterium]|nr:MAG: hypothetical protein IPM65_04295 [Candidatus Roizmanbacteria bacterium]